MYGRVYKRIGSYPETSSDLPTIIVEVLAKNLRGRLDGHGKPYKPTLHLYAPEPLYKVVKVFRVSSRRQVLRKGITDLGHAQAIVRSYEDSSRSMVVYNKY